MKAEQFDSFARYLAAVLSITAVTVPLSLFSNHVNPTTAALAFLLVVLFNAAKWGSGPAIVVSILGVLLFNFFFLPPTGAFTIIEPENWVALAAFLITAVTAGQLSVRVRQRAEEAENRRREIERLYAELQDAFERASHAEALRRSELLKSSLLDAVTHDLRTPLTSIKASVTTLLEELRTKPDRAGAMDVEGRREMLEVIDEETDRLNRFIEGLVELARIEAGEMHLRRRLGAVDEMILIALQRAEPLTRGHVIETSIEPDLPAIRVDPRAVAEVIYTLIDNAAKYSPARSRIRVSAARARDDLVQLAVEDEGAGIPAELRERVFDKFFRATRGGDSSASQPAGTGVGLAIARGIVEAHGGRIRVDDNDGGRGARVVFTLPIGHADAASGELFEETESYKQ
ncbi:MAG TPA: ATP-binding protein [Blastocatellia bacterium]|nr:ATP-binding protein [Blastocatellia bacterium]